MKIRLNDISVNVLSELIIDGGINYQFKLQMEEGDARALSDFLKMPENSEERLNIHERQKLKNSISATLSDVNKWVLDTGKAGCCNNSNRLHDIEQQLKSI